MLKVDESLGAKVGKGRRVGSCAIESPDDGRICFGRITRDDGSGEIHKMKKLLKLSVAE